jgi:hypothetical protein
MHPKEIVTREVDEEEEMKNLEQNYEKKYFFKKLFFCNETIRK